jgi:hypothetical protein
MRRITGMLAALMLAGFQLTAQEINLNNLLVPTSPGLVILDKAPASVEKPTSPKTLGISVLRLIKQNEGALDFTPYWFFNHASYTFDKHIDNKFPILQTLNLSVAASQGDTSSYFSAGVRTHLFRKYSTGKRNEIKAKKDAIVAALSVLPDDLDLNKIASLKNELAALTAEPEVTVELAGAMAGYSQDDKFSNLANNRYGAWLNIAYKPLDKLPLSALGVFRYTKAVSRTNMGLDSSFIDYGIAASYQQPKFDLQLEYVNRTDTENDDNYNRLVLVGNYLIANNLVIVASFGKNFSEVKNIVALFGVKFGIANERLK